MHKLTYLLLILVLTTLGFSLVRHRILTSAAIAGQKDPDHHKRVNERFPTVDYKEQELLDTEKSAQRKEKQKRYNDGKLVYSQVEASIQESVFTPEPHFTFPSLPVAESDAIVVGVIGTGQAHLSENKKNIFSEFTLVVEDVLKSKLSGVAQGTVLTLDRIGGHVKYPNGQTVLYRIAGINMPQTGSRYLFFLTAKHNQQDLSILTGYELTQNGVIPLDEELPQVSGLTGVSEADILQRVRNLIRNPSN